MILTLRLLRPLAVGALATGLIVSLTMFALADSHLHVPGDSDGDHLVDAVDPQPNVFCGTSHADVDVNGIVNIFDVVAALSDLGSASPDEFADQNHNGFGDWIDVSVIVRYLGLQVADACISTVADPVPPISGSGSTSGPAVELSAPEAVEIGASPVEVTVSATGSFTDPFIGFWISLRFDPAVVQAVDAVDAGEVMLNAVCSGLYADNTAGHARFGCVPQPWDVATSTGALASFEFDVVTNGDPQFALSTFGEPDQAGVWDGSYTIGLDFGAQVASPWTLVGSMNEARNGHTATTLPETGCWSPAAGSPSLRAPKSTIPTPTPGRRFPTCPWSGSSMEQPSFPTGGSSLPVRAAASCSTLTRIRGPVWQL
jgi:hypothetical protein